jgi:regulatory protein
LLARAPRTAAELEARLVQLGYRRETAAATVARCRELGYVDDARLAYDRAAQLRARGAGSLRIAADLAARGLPEALIADAVAASREGVDESTWARRALERAGATGARAWRLLASRGFPEAVIADLLGDGG